MSFGDIGCPDQAQANSVQALFSPTKAAIFKLNTNKLSLMHALSDVHKNTNITRRHIYYKPKTSQCHQHLHPQISDTEKHNSVKNSEAAAANE